MQKWHYQMAALLLSTAVCLILFANSSGTVESVITGSMLIVTVTLMAGGRFKLSIGSYLGRKGWKWFITLTKILLIIAVVICLIKCLCTTGNYTEYVDFELNQSETRQ